LQEVTGAAGNVILELNGEPAHIMVGRRLVQAMEQGSTAPGALYFLH
jgi:hypothetical protein